MKSTLLRPLLVSLLLLAAPAASAQVTVGNVRAAQRTGTKLVDVDFDITGIAAPVTVSLEISADGGMTYSVPATALTGAVGPNITPATNLRITWNAGADWNSQNSAQARFRIKVGGLGPDPDFAAIPDGSFTMGDTLDGMGYAPPHTVNVSAFQMQKNLVTLTDWVAVRDWGSMHGYTSLGGGSGKAIDHPVQSVSWYDVVKWCNAKSEMEGLTPCYYTDIAQNVIYKNNQELNITNEMVNWSASGYRLPTEAEWEKAARGGLTGQRFPWGDTISHTEANFRNDGGESYQTDTAGYHPTYATGSEPYTSPTGSFAPNGYGLYDMSGNVWQWCWDWRGPYSTSIETDPHGNPSSDMRIFRGGNWKYSASWTRCAYRNYAYPNAGYNYLGFRPVRCGAADARQVLGESGNVAVETRDGLLNATYVSGDVSGTWTTNGSPYVVQANVTVDYNTQLTIEPGVVVRFEKNTGMFVRGTMTTLSDAANPVMFTSHQSIPVQGDWRGITIISDRNSSYPNVVLDHCLLEYAVSGLDARCYGGNPGVAILNLQMNDVAVRHCMGFGVVLYAVGSSAWSSSPGELRPVLNKCRIFANGGSGIQCEAYRGVSSSGNIRASITNNEVFGNGGHGIEVLAHEDDFISLDGLNNVLWGNAGAGLSSQGMKGKFQNNIVVNNATGVSASRIDGTPEVTYNDVWGNGTNWAELAAPYETAVGNFSADPLFANPAAGDFHLRSQAGRYDDATGTWVLDPVTSPCIDAGDPTATWTTEPQPSGERIDIGSYGGTALASKSYKDFRLACARDGATQDGVLSWGCLPTQTYTLLYSDSPAGPWFDDLPGCQLTARANQTLMTYTHPNGGPAPRRFYRVRRDSP